MAPRQRVSRSALKSFFRNSLGVSNALWTPTDVLVAGGHTRLPIQQPTDALLQIELGAARDTLGHSYEAPQKPRISPSSCLPSQPDLATCERALVTQILVDSESTDSALRAFRRIRLKLGLSLIKEPDSGSPVSEVLFAGRILATLPADLVPAVNVVNFMEGHYAAVYVSEGQTILVNLHNLAQALNGQISNNCLVLEILPLLAKTGRLRLLASTTNLYKKAKVSTAPRAIVKQQSAIVIPSFNRPALVRRLIESLAEVAEIYEAKSPIIYVFDDSQSAAIVQEHVSIVQQLSHRVPSIFYIGHTRAWPEHLKHKNSIMLELEPTIGRKLTKQCLGHSIGGNCNWGYSLIGGRQPVVNLDQDVLPLVKVSPSVLRSTTTSMIEESPGLLCLEHGKETYAPDVVEIPVNLFKWINPELQVPFALTGDEISTTDDGSYEWMKPHDFTPKSYTCRVAHVCGSRDLYARRILVNSLEQGRHVQSDLDYGCFLPSRPVLPVVVRKTKLISTTITYVDSQSVTGPFGTIGTSLRYIDFVMGLQREFSGEGDLLIAPLYLSHQREYGLHDETDYGAYLLNEDYVDVIVGLFVELRGIQPQARARPLTKNLKALATGIQLTEEARYIANFGLRLLKHIKELGQGDALNGLVQSIERHYMGQPGSSLDKCIAHHASHLENELDLIIRQLEIRGSLNKLLSTIPLTLGSLEINSSSKASYPI